MSVFDLEDLLAEIDPSSPCGEDVSYDTAFLELENLLRPKSAGFVDTGEGETVQEPNWRDVAEQSYDLLRRSKHLGVAVYFLLGLLKTEGLPGLRDGLYVLHGLLEHFWDHVFPQLDPGDNYDPMERLNLLLSLSPTSIIEQDPIQLRQRLLNVSLCDSRQMGRFSFRDVLIAKGDVSLGENLAVADISVIDAAFRDTSEDELLDRFEAAKGSVELVDKIVDVFSLRATGGQTPDLHGLQKDLKKILLFLSEYLERESLPDVASGGDVSEGGPCSKSIPSEVQTRDDAIKQLDNICRYFNRHEPSSPVPLLLRRAQRLVSKSFLEIIQDVCPGAVSEVERISGALESEA